MATEVTHGAATEVHPVAPFERMVDVRRELAGLRGAEPEVPIHASGHGARSGRGGHVGVTIAGIGVPGVHGEDFADATGLDELHAGAVFFRGVNLVTHLGPHLGFRGLQAKLTRLPDGVRERLLAVDVLAHAHGDHGRQRMHVVGRRNGHGVEAVTEPGEHLAPVAVMRHAGVLLINLGEAASIDVAEADEMGLGVRGAFVDVGFAFAVDADRGDLDLRVQVTCSDDRGKGEGRERGGAQEVSTGEGHGWGGVG